MGDRNEAITEMKPTLTAALKSKETTENLTKDTIIKRLRNKIKIKIKITEELGQVRRKRRQVRQIKKPNIWPIGSPQD